MWCKEGVESGLISCGARNELSLVYFMWCKEGVESGLISCGARNELSLV